LLFQDSSAVMVFPEPHQNRTKPTTQMGVDFPATSDPLGPPYLRNRSRFAKVKNNSRPNVNFIVQGGRGPKNWHTLFCTP